MENNIDLESLSIEQLELLLEKKQKKGIAYSDVTERGGIKNTLGNFQLLLLHYNITIRYNEMNKELEIDIPGYVAHRDIESNAEMAELRSRAHEQGFPVSEIDSYVISIGGANSYHPVRDWLNNVTWDGQDRLQDYYDSVILATDHPLKQQLMFKWALSAVAALYRPNFSAEGVLTLAGPQGIGKTRWFKRLLPAEFQHAWTKDGVALDTKNKDSVSKALKYWITELGEIDATFKKTDIAALKAFLTEATDVFRNPYERKNNSYQRRTVFVGSVNDIEFLRDDENRRFWVLNVERFDYSTELDVAQFWAQIRTMYDVIVSDMDRVDSNQYGWYLAPEERATLRRMQEYNKIIDPIEEILSNCVDVSKTTGTWQNCTEILQNSGIDRPTRSEANTASKWLQKQGYSRRREDKKFLVLVRGQMPTTGTTADPDSKVLDWRTIKK